MSLAKECRKKIAEDEAERCGTHDVDFLFFIGQVVNKFLHNRNVRGAPTSKRNNKPEEYDWS